MSRGKILIATLIGGAFLVYPLVFRLPFQQHVMIMVFVFAALGEAWNILGGFAGQTSLGHAVFFGIGAYTSTLMLTWWGVSPWIGMVVGGLIAALISLIVGYACFRFRGYYLAIATIALGQISQLSVMNWDLVGGAIGIFFPLLEESFWNFQFHSSKLPYYYISLAMLALVLLAVSSIETSKLGYYLKAIKGDEEAAESIGVNVPKYKQIALTLSAVFTAMLGTFYAQYVLFIDPGSVMSSTLSVQIVLIAALGGSGTVLGPILGALVLVPISEFSRAYLGGGGRGLDLVLYGILMVLISVFQPAGLMGWIRDIGPLFNRGTRVSHEAVGSQRHD